jgi:hypothetical protein
MEIPCSLVEIDIIDVELILLFFVSHEFASENAWFSSGCNLVLVDELDEICHFIFFTHGGEDELLYLTLFWIVHLLFYFILKIIIS